MDVRAQYRSQHDAALVAIAVSTLGLFGRLEPAALDAACTGLQPMLLDQQATPALLTGMRAAAHADDLDTALDWCATLSGADASRDKAWLELLALTVLRIGFSVLDAQPFPGLHWPLDLLQHAIRVGTGAGLHVDDVSAAFADVYPKTAAALGASLVEPTGARDSDGACRLTGLLPDWAVDSRGTLLPAGPAMAAAVDRAPVTGRSRTAGGYELTAVDVGIPVQVLATTLDLRWCRLDNVIYNDADDTFPPTLRLAAPGRDVVPVALRVRRTTAQMCAALARPTRTQAYLADPGLIEPDALAAWTDRTAGMQEGLTAEQAAALVAGVPIPAGPVHARPRLFS